MNTYNIAGLKVNFEPFGRTYDQAEKYRCDYEPSPDIEILIKERNIEKYISLYSSDRNTAFYMLSGCAFYRDLLEYDGFMLHSSALAVDGKAYLFSGQSSIGKSTHAGYWKELLPGRCVTINDDKPAIRFVDGRAFVCGTPWSGKYDMSENVMVPLGAICFISRSDSNEICRLDNKSAAMRILDQSNRGVTEGQWDKLFSMIEKLAENIPVYKLGCINDISAAVLSHNIMTGEDK